MRHRRPVQSREVETETETPTYKMLHTELGHVRHQGHDKYDQLWSFVQPKVPALRQFGLRSGRMVRHRDEGRPEHDQSLHQRHAPGSQGFPAAGPSKAVSRFRVLLRRRIGGRRCRSRE